MSVIGQITCGVQCIHVDCNLPCHRLMIVFVNAELNIKIVGPGVLDVKAAVLIRRELRI